MARTHRRMRKRLAKKLSWKRRDVVDLLSIQPGDIRQNCDFFNHVVTRVEPHRAYTKGRHGKAWFVADVSVYYTNEDEQEVCFCGCPAGAEPPYSAEEIRRSTRAYYSDPENVASLKRDGWWTERSQQMADRVASGHPLCDERGVAVV